MKQCFVKIHHGRNSVHDSPFGLRNMPSGDAKMQSIAQRFRILLTRFQVDTATDIGPGGRRRAHAKSLDEIYLAEGKVAYSLQDETGRFSKWHRLFFNAAS
jgi:hypothetical protein